MDAILLTHLALAVQISLGATFLMSAWPKLRQPQLFANSVVAYDILPDKIVHVFSWILIVSETFMAITLLTGLWADIALGIVFGLLLIFLVAVVINLKRGRKIDCGCFGDANEQISPRTMTRLLLLLGLAMILALVRGAGYAPPNPIMLIANPSTIADLILAICVAAFIITFGAWLMRLPELLWLARGNQKT